MRTIDIIFTRSKKKLAIFSKLIMWWTDKPYSHVARRGKISFTKDSHYYQASEGKVNYEYGKYFRNKHEIVTSYSLNVSDEIYRDMVKTSWSQAGAKYGALQNLGIVLVDTLSYVNVHIKNPFIGGMNCSELMYVTVFKPMLPNLKYNENTIKPHHIEEIILNNNLHVTDNN